MRREVLVQLPGSLHGIVKQDLRKATALSVRLIILNLACARASLSVLISEAKPKKGTEWQGSLHVGEL